MKNNTKKSNRNLKEATSTKHGRHTRGAKASPRTVRRSDTTRKVTNRTEASDHGTGDWSSTHGRRITANGRADRITAGRARELARIARDLDEHKSSLAYGEFEKWALKAYPAFPIQVLRYLRKAHRTFGKDLEKLFDRLGQKKVFLLLGLDDPWAPIRQGVTLPGTKGLADLTTLSVKQLRDALRDQVRHVATGRRGRKPTLLGGLSTVYDRLSSVWPRLRNTPAARITGARATGTIARLTRFRSMLEEVLGKIDQVIGPTTTGRNARTTKPSGRKHRD